MAESTTGAESHASDASIRILSEPGVTSPESGGDKKSVKFYSARSEQDCVTRAKCWVWNVTRRIQETVSIRPREYGTSKDLSNLNSTGSTGTESTTPSGIAGPWLHLLFQRRYVNQVRRSIGSGPPVVISVILLSQLGLGCGFLFLGWLLWEFDEVATALHHVALGGSSVPPDPAIAAAADMETVGWLNSIINLIWGDCLREFFAREATIAINEWLERRGSGLHILDLDVGNDSPWISGIKCFTHERPDGTDELFIDLGIHFRLNTNIVGRNYFCFGMRRLHFSGPVRVTLTRARGQQNVASDIKISLLALPAIDYEASGLLGFLNVAFLKATVKVIHSYVLGFFVYPRQYTVFASALPVIQPTTPFVPKGLISMKILSSKGLDTSCTPYLSISMKENRPYTIVSLTSENEVSRSNEKRYVDYVIEFPVTESDLSEELISVEAISHNCSRCFSLSGIPVEPTKIPMKLVEEKGIIKVAMTLGNKSGGEVHALLQYLRFQDEGRSSSDCQICSTTFLSRAVLSVTVMEIRSADSVRPFLAISAAGGPASATSPPEGVDTITELAEAFLFPIRDVTTDKVDLVLLDADSPGEVLPKEFDIENREGVALPCIKNLLRARKHFHLLGRKTLNLEELTGRRQVVQLENDRGEPRSVILIGQLSHLSCPLKSRKTFPSFLALRPRETQPCPNPGGSDGQEPLELRP